MASLVHKEVSTRLMTLLAPQGRPATEVVPAEILKDLQESMENLMEVDWADMERGFYPRSLLFTTAWRKWIQYYPLLCLDMPTTWNRRIRRNVTNLPNSINKSNYPNYYLQNFHNQTDGYLSDHSANLYDLQVEILFNGTADAMRRRILPPLLSGLQYFKSQSPWQMKILDVGTGTGKALQQINGALPHAQLIGLDLSAAYLQQVKNCFEQDRESIPQLVQAKAEKIPFSSNSIEGITCVFLLHELPAEVRQNVLNECFRVLRPGGVLVLADSIQLAHSPQFRVVIENFRRIFHEPYYYNYVNDDITARIQAAGFEHIFEESHFLTKVWYARK
ncbi:MAG TPA: class I SAM-dependent methyltransferase [Prochlorococcaceae cyanobacterium AMR_MDS_5431]|nr:class I SAM-dependent methyltransferase [Prochlorococcaceae cyanobacterium AMR_MDS_5431]